VTAKPDPIFHCYSCGVSVSSLPYFRPIDPHTAFPITTYERRSLDLLATSVGHTFGSSSLDMLVARRLWVGRAAGCFCSAYTGIFDYCSHKHSVSVSVFYHNSFFVSALLSNLSSILVDCQFWWFPLDTLL